eukprot:SAG31_NODE_2254_length_6073_cov_3.048711_6_plen_195_part_00
MRISQVLCKVCGSVANEGTSRPVANAEPWRVTRRWTSKLPVEGARGAGAGARRRLLLLLSLRGRRQDPESCEKSDTDGTGRQISLRSAARRRNATRAARPGVDHSDLATPAAAGAAACGRLPLSFGAVAEQLRLLCAGWRAAGMAAIIAEAAAAARQQGNRPGNGGGAVRPVACMAMAAWAAPAAAAAAARQIY